MAELIRAERSGGPEVIIHAGLSGVAAHPGHRLGVRPRGRPARRAGHAVEARPSPSSASFDIVVAGGILLLASPVLAVIAILVKREDGGPVLFRQQRVGRGDEEFGMLKFRTMVVDAEARLAAMEQDNQRTGPLFKMARDPRITQDRRTSCAARASTSCPS